MRPCLPISTGLLLSRNSQDTRYADSTETLTLGVVRNAPDRIGATPGRHEVAKGQMKSNREKKKPKADKNKVKAAAPVSPFAPARSGNQPRGKGGKS